jgi:hypothetical protein
MLKSASTLCVRVARARRNGARKRCFGDGERARAGNLCNAFVQPFLSPPYAFAIAAALALAASTAAVSWSCEKADELPPPTPPPPPPLR